jgi:hypothetical protein
VFWLVSGFIASDARKIADSAFVVNIYFADTAIIFRASPIGHEQDAHANPCPAAVWREVNVDGGQGWHS